MKNILLGVLALIAVGVVAFFALKPAAPDQSQVATTIDTTTGSQPSSSGEQTSGNAMSDVSGEQYSIAQNSVLKWLGRKVGGEHTGTIALTDGFIRVEKGMIKAGQFGVDMKSIVVSDITDAGMNTKLVEHLKSADFFDVEKNPTAMFMLNEVFASGSEMIARGDLTVKGTTHPLQFPIIVTQEGNQMRVKADFFIDKDLWSISSNPVVDKYLGIGFDLQFGPAL